jgi:hypothetical protein
MKEHMWLEEICQHSGRMCAALMVQLAVPYRAHNIKIPKLSPRIDGDIAALNPSFY